MPAEFDSGAFIREPAWHREGVVLPDFVSPSEMQVYAGLDWEVETWPLYSMSDDGDMIDVEGKRATVRLDTERALGVVSSSYEPIQNTRLFEFAQDLADDDDVKIETAGALRGGQRIWLQVRLGENLLVDKDETIPYLTLATSHDGTLAFSAFPTFVRIVCANTFNHAYNTKSVAYKVKHTPNAQVRVNDARELLDLAFRQTEEFTKQVERFANNSITDARVDELLKQIWPEPKDEESSAVARREEKRAKVRHMYDTFPTIEPVRGSEWGFINAVNEYEQWYGNVRSTGSRKVSRTERMVQHFLAGEANRLTRKAIALVS